MIYVKELTTEEIITLSEMHKNHPLHLTRMRSHSILLSHKKLSVPTICVVYGVCRQTVSCWFSKWEKRGAGGLIDLEGRGRPEKTSEEQKKTL